MTLIDWVIPFRLIDLVEILLVTYLIYRLYQLMRGTIAVQIFLGVLAIYLLQILVTYLDMTMLRTMLGSVSEVFVIAVIILFQPEIRRLLLFVGQNPLLRRLIKAPVQDHILNSVSQAASELGRRRIGALIAIERSTGLRSLIETGEQIQAKVTRDMLMTLFYGQNPLHDGAVIISNGRIEAARCVLPVSQNMNIASHLGLRHRAGLGLSEQTDAFVIIVSEESGSISVAENGQLHYDVTPAGLRQHLEQALTSTSEASTDGGV
ncbi:MAG: TIGR00159 family protein [Bacteroidetes bacterium]|nr:TIGR00159 family protein [Bacteroidota bacterium]